MRKVFFVVGLFVLIFASFGVYIATFDINILSSDKEQKHPKFWDFRVITHVVTKETRGSLEPREILLAAARSQVDVLFLTDLNLLNRSYNIQGYHGDIFTFTNQKISYLDSHVLVYTDDIEFKFPSLSLAQTQLGYHFSRPNLDSPTKYLTVLAHPLKARHTWTGKFPKGLDGIEVVNLRKLWQDVWFNDRPNFIASLAIYPFNPNLALTRLLKNPTNELKLWDRLNQEARSLGFLGSETTSKIYNLIGLNFSFPKYFESFEFASNHLLLESELTGNEKRDRQKIFDGIRKGHFYLALDTFGNPDGFGAYVQHNEKSYLFGDSFVFAEGQKLYIDLPENINVPFEVELYHNGVRIWTSKSAHSHFDIKEPGNYRIIVRIQPDLPIVEGVKWYSWIYTNNFYIN